jgi:hypothetical protein
MKEAEPLRWAEKAIGIGRWLGEEARGRSESAQKQMKGSGSKVYFQTSLTCPRCTLKEWKVDLERRRGKL